jgi:multiple sugar transport system substrate-binding protein
MTEFVSKDMAIPLDDYMVTDPNLALEKWIPGAFSENLQVFNGVTYGLPSGDSPKVIWFNPDLFTEAGIMSPLEYEAEGEWNWDTFLEVALALTSGEGATKRFGYQTWMAREDTDNTMRSFGGGWTNLNATEVWATKPESIEGLQYLLDLYLVHKVAPLSQDEQAAGGGQQMFFTRRLAMFMSGIWEVYGLRQGQTPYDVAPMPEGPAGRFMSHAINSLVITRSSKHPDEAWQLLRFLKSPGMEKIMVQGEGFMPFQKASIPTFLENGDINNAQVFIDALEKGWGYPIAINVNGDKMDQVVWDAVGLALSEGRDAEWVVNEVAPKLEPLVG